MTHPATEDRPGALAAVVALAFGLRAIAAVGVEWAVKQRRGPGALCLFDDATVYWALGGAIRAGGPYEVGQFGVPHRALRTPGYPLFLAACQAAFGASNTLAPRLVQAGFGALGVWVLARLVRRVRPDGPRHVGLIAAALAAVEPYSVAMSALLLSEAVFVPLMLLALWGLASLWAAGPAGPPRHPLGVGLAAGIAAGAAILARPSWALFVPLALAAWVVASPPGRRRAALRGAAAVGLGLVVAMGPWWARNARVLGRFVPTALWLGASLYDGLSPAADGASDMRFLAAPGIVELDEPAQDRALRDRALAFAAEHPGRALRLAAVKAARFWSPWPNADQFRSPVGAALSALVTLPLYALMLVGARDRRRDARALVLLAGPLLTAAAVHLVFVSSIRYRIPVAVPALGLAAIGAGRIANRKSQI